MSSNRSLHKAHRAKDDECYTRIEDIDKEIAHYPEAFDGKAVYCNCDDPRRSQFVRYFLTHFDRLGLRRLDASGLDPDFRGVGLTCSAQPSDVDEYIESNTIDLFDGSFDWYENRRTLAESDIIATNPPFSLFGDFMDFMMTKKKKFLVVGNMNALKYKEIWPYVRDGKVWLGCNRIKDFETPRDGMKSVLARWFTNLSHKKRNEELVCYQRFNPTNYPEYDNIDAIEVSNVSDIPCDYDGVMGVPITFMDKYNPKQFEIIGLDRDIKWGHCPQYAKSDWHGALTAGVVNGKEKYARILIRHVR